MIREMMEPEARRGERPTYRKPYPAYIDQMPLSPANSIQTWEHMENAFHEYDVRIQPEITITIGQIGFLKTPVDLKLPSGAEMEIELRRSKVGWVWFDKGWPEFSKLCSLDYEIEYPKPGMEETDSDSEDDDDESGHARGEIKTGENDMPTKKDFGGSSSNQIFVKRTPDVLGRMHPLTKSEKALALQRANAFKSEYPYFLVAIQPVYIHRGYLHLPSKFARRHLVKQPARNIILKIFEMEELGLLPLSPGHGGVAIDRVEKRRNPIIKVETDCTTNYEHGKYKRLKIGGQVTQRPLRD
ncbi:hypothetical protein L3X38_037727 [Prunus dulcis]|uniref:Uncharacterized protein n=1 Tax=Prunus dulcis TaxID=3755 RepID=A0AAD4V567_PRUDU|nr:hypothetical protein L3X38_037727 [Prunus dulcis]